MFKLYHYFFYVKLGFSPGSINLILAAYVDKPKAGE